MYFIRHRKSVIALCDFFPKIHVSMFFYNKDNLINDRTFRKKCFQSRDVIYHVLNISRLITYISRSWLPCFGILAFLLPKTFKLFGFQIFIALSVPDDVYSRDAPSVPDDVYSWDAPSALNSISTCLFQEGICTDDAWCTTLTQLLSKRWCVLLILNTRNSIL